MTYTSEQDTGTSVKDEAAGVAQDAKAAGSRVASTAKDAAQQVAGDAKTQGRELLHTTGNEVRAQAATQQQRLAGGLRTVGGELHTMADSSQEHGFASDVAQRVAGRVDSVAGWLESREPTEVLDEVKQFARRRPGVFIAVAAGTGVLLGRLVRSLVSSDEKPRKDDRSMASSMETVDAPIYEETVSAHGGAI